MVVAPGPGYLSLQRPGVLDFTENRQHLLSHIIVASESQGDLRSWLEILNINRDIDRFESCMGQLANRSNCSFKKAIHNL